MRRPVVVAVLIAVAGVAFATALGGSGGGARTNGASAAPTLLGPTDPATPVDFSVGLRVRRGAVRSFLADVRDPASPEFRRHLDAKGFGRRFGLSPRVLGSARRRLHRAGVRVIRSYPQRTALRARASAGDLERLFGVRLGNFVDAEGRRYRAPLEPARVPSGLRAAVSGLSGLDTRPLVRPAAAPAEGLKPADIEAAYDIGPLHEMGINGEGQTVAIVSYDSFNDSDVALYDELTGTEGPPVEHVPVNGGTEVGPGSTEVNLDIDTIRAIAPKAQILNYESPNSGVTFAPVFDQIVAEGRADIVSMSWGICDKPEYHSQQDRDADLRSLEAASAQGISFFVSSADAGAYACQHYNPEDDRVSIDFPSATPFVTSVGGTLLSVREDGSYLEEFGWEDVVSHGGGGGGVSDLDERPDWQRGPGVDNEQSTGKRQIPDVAGPADPDSGVFLVNDGQPGASGGTSAAAPFWAGSMVLVRQYVERESGKKGLGFVNPILYELGATEQEFPPYHDVVRGGNRFHNAGPGWDFSTGLGSPDVFNLARAFNAYFEKK